MDIAIEKENETLRIHISGRLDTMTAPKLEQTLEENADGVTALILDLDGLTYTSSAGLRIFLKAQKKMNRQGTMKLCNVCPSVMEILEVTGFTDFLTIEAAV